MRVERLAAALALCAATMLGARAGQASACSIDGVPSLTVNGYQVVINKVVPKLGADLRLWAPFVLPFPLHTHRAEDLAEITQRVALQPIAFKTPWRWNFGDGTRSARGMKVTHVFARPGTYKVTVEAYFPAHHFWYTFDAVQVHVLNG